MSTSYARGNDKAEAALVAELNDLLQLDYDAVAAYTLALRALDDFEFQDAVRSFKADHERHIEELTGLIKQFGGIPMPMPHISGVFKLAVQGVGAAGNDAAVITTFKSNEVQSRDKYRRAASRQHPVEVQDVLIRASRDEQRHFDWAMRALGELGVNTGHVADAIEQMHARNADSIEAVERGAMYYGERARRAVKQASPPVKMIGFGLIMLGTALAVRAMTRD